MTYLSWKMLEFITKLEITLSFLPKCCCISLSLKVISVAFGNIHSSSRMDIIPSGFSINSIVAAKSIPKSIISHSIPHSEFQKLFTNSRILTDETVRGTLTFFFVFFLFKNKHVMVEELLKLFICEVNAKLFKSVEFENFKTSNILIFFLAFRRF